MLRGISTQRQEKFIMTIWTSVFSNLDKYFNNLDKYDLQYLNTKVGKVYYDMKEGSSLSCRLIGLMDSWQPPLRPDRPISILNARNVDPHFHFLIFKTPRVPCIYGKYVQLHITLTIIQNSKLCFQIHLLFFYYIEFIHCREEGCIELVEHP